MPLPSESSCFDIEIPDIKEILFLLKHILYFVRNRVTGTKRRGPELTLEEEEVVTALVCENDVLNNFLKDIQNKLLNPTGYQSTMRPTNTLPESTSGIDKAKPGYVVIS